MKNNNVLEFFECQDTDIRPKRIFKSITLSKTKCLELTLDGGFETPCLWKKMIFGINNFVYNLRFLEILDYRDCYARKQIDLFSPKHTLQLKKNSVKLLWERWSLKMWVNMIMKMRKKNNFGKPFSKFRTARTMMQGKKLFCFIWKVRYTPEVLG